jgi:hypothetical protein
MTRLGIGEPVWSVKITVRSIGGLGTMKQSLAATVFAPILIHPAVTDDRSTTSRETGQRENPKEPHRGDVR